MSVTLGEMRAARSHMPRASEWRRRVLAHAFGLPSLGRLKVGVSQKVSEVCFVFRSILEISSHAGCRVEGMSRALVVVANTRERLASKGQGDCE